MVISQWDDLFDQQQIHGLIYLRIEAMRGDSLKIDVSFQKEFFLFQET